MHLRAVRLGSLGLVLDFAELKRMMNGILDRFDHRVVNDIPPFDERNTTAELFSEDARLRLAETPRVEVSRVEVWENESSCAVYEPRQ